MRAAPSEGEMNERSMQNTFLFLPQAAAQLFRMFSEKSVAAVKKPGQNRLPRNETLKLCDGEQQRIRFGLERGEERRRCN